MAHSLYTDVTAAVRAYLNDQTVTGGATYDDTFLQPYVWLAQQTMVNYLISNAVRRLQYRTILYIPAGTKILLYEDDPNPYLGLGPESLTNGRLVLGGGGWTVSGDFVLAFSPTTGVATFSKNTGAGTLEQAAADLGSPGLANTT